MKTLNNIFRTLTVTAFSVVALNVFANGNTSSEVELTDIKRNKSIVELNIALPTNEAVESIVIERAGDNKNFRPVKVVEGDEMNRATAVGTLTTVDNYPLPYTQTSAYRLTVSYKSGAIKVLPAEILHMGEKVFSAKKTNTEDENLILGYENSLHVTK